ncbi:MAG: ATP-dependent Clp protease adapter ClpS [Bacteriovorax sp.]|nr:ATP-dependent Clp protease adapter ClpS [Bacteriovorax sp.]
MTDHNPKHDEEGGTATIIRKKVQLPKKYKVLLHNDDYTTMEFVIYILQSVFHKDINEAERIMIQVHRNGIGVCGVYTHEIAESKAKKVERMAKEHSHPLLCTIEPE